MASTQRIAKKRKFVADGVMFAEITELLGKVRRRGANAWTGLAILAQRVSIAEGSGRSDSFGTVP
jgi:shikimate 5-dehydrogenase